MTDRNQRFTALRRSMWAPLCELTATAAKQKGSVEQRLGRLENELAVRDVLNKYTYCYDSSDLDGVMSVFHDDCTLVNPRGTYVGAEAIRRNYRYLISCRKFSFHHVSNAVVRLSDEAREAGFTGYFNCVIAFRSGALTGGSGTYAVRLTKVGDEWKIIECRITLNTRHNMTPTFSGEIAPSSSPDAPPPPPQPTASESSRDWIGPDALA